MTMSELDGRKAEQWFRRRGLPAVVRGLEDNLTARIVPAVVWLGLTEVLYEVLTAVDGDAEFPTKLENALFRVLYTVTLIGTIVFPLVGSWLAAAWARDRVLDDRGFVPAVVIVAGYVVMGTVVDTVLHGNEIWSAALEYLAWVVSLLGLTAVGVGSIFGWALRAAVRQLRSVGTMTSRAMPLMLLVTTFGFYTAEIWQSAGQIPRDQMWLVLVFFAVLGALFLRSVFVAELRGLTTEGGWRHRVGALPDDPFATLTTPADVTAPPLTRLERANMLLILLLTQLLQALVFATLVFFAYVVLGSLTVPHDAVKSWVSHDPTPGEMLGVQIPLSNELVQVCLFIAAFSTLYFLATIVTDAAQRKTFFDPVLDHLEVSLAGRAVYLAHFEPRSAARRSGEGDRQPQP
ncbi:hypothetical protein [Lentzea nigeriaca]|uniref:hypothetical protein n=1 Tax=Lentzea nigeriaca TaxID=1128665 RepID=UPI00195DCB11|nr:hypothetical protein [Lentzea nigeriaca]MBM7864256.1 hypothetical protein [Lentzea nigeriaca]